MKKLVTLLLAVVLLTPVVKAAELNVKELTTKTENNSIKYSGTTDEGVLAVSCSLYNSENEEIDISSNAVNNNTFEGIFTVTKEDTYTVKCANYEGGKIVEATITEATKQQTTNPATGDHIMKYAALLGISVIGIAGLTIYTRKTKKNK